MGSEDAKAEVETLGAGYNSCLIFAIAGLYTANRLDQ